jgi:hypothetical protein
MSFTPRELWTVIHGMGLGAVFLLAFSGVLAGLWSFRTGWLTAAGLKERLPRLLLGTWVMAVVSWLTVISGTYIAYPWYRAKPPSGADLLNYPRNFLLAHPNLAAWHTFGMEWKEHVAWLSPILATAVAYVVTRYGLRLAENDKLRGAVMALFVISFAAAAVAGLFGAFITKVVPVH